MTATLPTFASGLTYSPFEEAITQRAAPISEHRCCGPFGWRCKWAGRGPVSSSNRTCRCPAFGHLDKTSRLRSREVGSPESRIGRQADIRGRGPLVEYDLPAMVHVSTSCNACFHTTGAHYLNADTTAFMQRLSGDLFKDFPTLKFLIPHGGGAVPYHWGRFRGLAQELKKPLLDEHLLNNIFFDTCVYHQPGIDLLTKVIPVKNILFASEMIGAVRGIDPTTGHYYDDTRRYVEATGNLGAEERHLVFEGNARRVFSRLDAQLKQKGL